MTEDDTPKPDRRSGDAAVLGLAEGLLAALGKAPSPDELQTLRAVAATYPDDGKDGAGEVVQSLLGLIDDLVASGAVDREALAVHVRAWRFMVSRKPHAPERAEVLRGLAAVRDLYAPPKATHAA